MQEKGFPTWIKVSITLFLILAIFQNARSQTITMPSIIGSNMVLQQNTQVPLWGWATSGTKVDLTPSWGTTTTIYAGTDGKWKTSIQTPVAVAGQAPQYSISVKGPSNTLTFSNILVGEVWLCSGQSNMSFPMNYKDASMLGVVDYQTEIAAANFPNIRLFTVPTSNSATPQTNCGGSWTSCSPTSVSNFSAVAYYFGRELFTNKALNVPVGIIHDSYSGSSIQAWMKQSVLTNDAELKAKYIDGTFTATETKPYLLYNAMIAPIIPFAIKGVVWYQGESNALDGATYTKANIAMINDWRTDWGIYFSFYAVQLTPRFWSTTQVKDLGYSRSMFREAQTNIQIAQKTGIVVTSDLMLNAAELTYAHTRMKKEVGQRLAYWALAKDYGQTIQYLGPKYQAFTIEGNKARISFTVESLGGGLITKDGLNPKCFKIAGSDMKFYPALAIIDGNTIVVSSTSVNSPVAVRYAFTEGAMTNLQNKEGIAAFPFRTDAWTTVTYMDLPEVTAVDKTELNSIKLFPNPFQHIFFVDGLNSGIKDLEMIDLSGKSLSFESEQKSSGLEINGSDLVAGVYFLKIVDNDMNIYNFKVIKL